MTWHVGETITDQFLNNSLRERAAFLLHRGMGLFPGENTDVKSV